MLYEGKLGLGFLRKAAENADWISSHGHVRGGVRFYGSHWVVFDSEAVDFDVIKEGVDGGDIIIHPVEKSPEEEEEDGGRINRIRRPNRMSADK